MSTLWHILLILGGLMAVVFLWGIIMAIRWEWNYRHRPPDPPFRCPTCASERIDIRYSGLWDGLGFNGEPTGGSQEYGICQQCGGLSARTNYDPSYIPSQQEWQAVVGPMDRLRREQESWPFEPMDEK